MSFFDVVAAHVRVVGGCLLNRAGTCAAEWCRHCRWVVHVQSCSLYGVLGHCKGFYMGC